MVLAYRVEIFNDNDDDDHQNGRRNKICQENEMEIS